MRILLSLVAVFFTCIISAQGFLRTNNQEIVNDNGPVLLRGIGTGNWLLQEGYMMQSTGAGVNTHTQFRNKLVASMGEEKTNEYYNAWVANHFTKKDLDFMKSKGLNSVRVALHYKWLTLPIEEEIKNKDGSFSNTWLQKGFEVIDELLSWCEQNKMYLILDMHGAPGGQGKDANISDYDSTKPSLWESENNKKKLELLWIKLAERYKNSEWIGGFDLINETNWSLDNSENKNGCASKSNNDLWDLHQRLIKAIRTVNKNHIIYISGNCWGNNYKSFDEHSLKNFDDNMVLTFHKYWNYNNDDSVAQWLKMREKYNLPLWMSEAGENSNAWFADCIALFEKNNIGWSWWPVKKSRVNNILKVNTGEKYRKLISAWEKEQLLSESETFEAVMEYVESHKFQNCVEGTDVIYAMLQQPGNTNTKAYKKHSVDKEILFADYDLGNNNFAYFDNVSANYHVSDGKPRATWNNGHFYRNDGVDIGNSNGSPYVGWTEQGEWLNYTIDILEEGRYSIEISYTAKNEPAVLSTYLNGNQKLTILELPKTTDNFSWKKTVSEQFFLPKGTIVLKMRIEKGGCNLLNFKLNKVLN